MSSLNSTTDNISYDLNGSKQVEEEINQPTTSSNIVFTKPLENLRDNKLLCRKTIAAKPFERRTFRSKTKTFNPTLDVDINPELNEKLRDEGIHKTSSIDLTSEKVLISKIIYS